MTLRILLADDHRLFADGLRGLLLQERGLEVVATAKDGREAVRLARQLRPDLVIMDLSMPGMSGIEATRQITSELAGIKVLCLSMHTETHFVEAALEAGARGYLLKDSALEELAEAVRTVSAGRSYLSPAVAGSVLEALRDHRPLAGKSAHELLTPREREVLQLVAEGRSTKEIAAELHVSTKTVLTHREHLMDKLRIRSVAGLTKYAVLEGLTSSGPEYTD